MKHQIERKTKTEKTHSDIAILTNALHKNQKENSHIH
jgi:hypothetical protein